MHTQNSAIRDAVDSVQRPHFFYGRVSSDDQAEDGTIEAQQHDLREWQVEHQPWVAGEFWDDPAHGTVLLEERAAAAEMIDAIRAVSHLNPILVITRMSRITRGDVWVYANAMRTLQSLNCDLYSLTEKFDSSPQGEFVRDVGAAVSRLHRATILQEMTKGRDRKVRAARWTNGPVPFGYTTDGPVGLLMPSETVCDCGFTEAEIAASVFHRMAYEGNSTVAEARRLNALRVSTARRYGNGTTVTVGETWLPSRIRQMIMNTVYKGKHSFKSKHGTIVRDVPILVEEQTWQLANRNLQRNRALSSRNAKQTYLLRGLIRCGNCGMGFAHTWVSGGEGRGKKSERYYRCGGKLGVVHPEAHERCRSKMLMAAPLEDEVWSKIKEFAADPQHTLAAAQTDLRRRLGTVADQAKREDEIRRLLASKDSERKEARQQQRRHLITMEELEEDLQTIEAESSTLRAELEGMRTQRELAEDHERVVTDAASMLRSLHERIVDETRPIDIEEKRKIVERLVSKIVVTTETVGEGPRPRKTAVVDVSFAFGRRFSAAVDTNVTTSDNNALTLQHRVLLGVLVEAAAA